MKKYHHIKKIKLQQYPIILVIAISNDYNKMVEEKIVHESVIADIDSSFAYTFFDGKIDGLYSVVILLHLWKDSLCIDLEDLVHETNHAGNRILQYIEAKPDLLNDEQESYLKSWIAGEIQSVMVENNITFKLFKSKCTKEGD